MKFITYITIKYFSPLEYHLAFLTSSMVSEQVTDIYCEFVVVGINTSFSVY